MALVRSGCFGKKSGGITAAIGKHLRNINLKPAKKITIKYDPFNANVKNIRDFNTLILSKKVVKTNLFCLIKTEIASDRSESQVLVDLVNGEKILLKCANLDTLEILEILNQYVTPLAPQEEPVTAVESKSDKKGKKKK